MLNESQTESQGSTNQTTEALDPGKLSFSEYEAHRRGELKLDAAHASALADKSAEQKKSEDSDTSEKEELEAKDESEEEAGEESEESKDTAEEKPKKKGGFQRRIDKLNGRIAAKDQELEYWKGLALKGGQAEPKKEEPAKVAAAQGQSASQDGKPVKPKLSEFSTFEEYEDAQAEYVEKLADWKTDQKLKAQLAEQEKSKLMSEQEKLIQTHTERVKSFAEKTEDFQDVLEAVDHIPVSPAVSELIVSSENGPALMYELAKDPKEFERINKLSPLAAARELGRIESKIDSASKASSEHKTEPKKLTKAPKPIEPVGGGKSAVAKSLDDPHLSFSDYERIRRDQMKRRRA